MTSNGNKRLHFQLTAPRIFMILFVLFTLAVTVYRFMTGLSVTNLDDSWTWGLWIIVDMVAIALAGAGFSMAFMTHVLHIGKFQKLSRRALLISICGYLFVLLVLIVEIGRWDNFYQPIIHPNLHSPMTEVLYCILVYVTLQVIEVVEVVSEKYSPKVKSILGKIMTVVFIVASLVPFGHQASLGSIYMAMPNKLDSLWSTSAQPWLFLISAFFVGFAIVTLEYKWASKRYNKEYDADMIASLLKIGSFIMLAFLALKIGDVVVRGEIGNVFAFDTQSIFWLLEVGLILVAVIMGLTGKIKTAGQQITFSVLTAVGVILTRTNVVTVGMVEYLGNTYFPSWIEIVMTIGLLFISVLIYLFAIENLPFYGIKTPAGVDDHGHGYFIDGDEK